MGSSVCFALFFAWCGSYADVVGCWSDTVAGYADVGPHGIDVDAGRVGWA